MPLNASRNSSSSGRRLLQQSPYVDANMQVVCQGCKDSSAMQAALTGATPAALLNAYASANGTHAMLLPGLHYGIFSCSSAVSLHACTLMLPDLVVANNGD